MTVYQVDEEIEPGLRYTEEFSRTVRSFSVGDYMLWDKESNEYIGGLNVLYFRQRIGAVAVHSAGIGGVETVPAYRRQGYAHKLLRRALASIAQRTPVVYLSEAIQGLYEKAGFVTCMAESLLEIEVRNVVRQAAGSGAEVQRFAKAALPPAILSAMIDVYNRAHAQRSWTHERSEDWNRLYETENWQPGSEVLVAEREGRLVGYAIKREEPFGWTPSPLTIDELAASGVEAARTLLAALAARYWELGHASFQVREPPDSAVGRAARQFGCTVRLAYPPSGEMMGAILDRERLLSMVEPELKRRAAGAGLDAQHGAAEHCAAFQALLRGEVLPDDGELLQLLVGHRSLADAVAEVPAPFERLLALWFPGGGTPRLPLPYAHVLDRY